MTPLTKNILITFFLLFIFFTVIQAQPPGGSGDGIWLRNAYYGEADTFDKCLAHQPGSGQYHNHVQPVCLRAQLDDNLTTVSSGRTGTVYKENSSTWKHSPILGWSFDGYPVYGPYGYTDPNNVNSAIKRIKSGFRLRSITQRTTLPDWAVSLHPGVSQQLSSNQYGPDVSTIYPLGRYLEDYEFVTGLGDLDQYNGRFAITPEYPSGTYAYYVTINDDGSPAFPFLIGMQYYGTVSGSSSATIPANATSYFANGSYTQTQVTTPQLNSWATKNSQQNAKVINGFDPSAGAVTIWPTNVPTGATISGGVSTPTKADAQTISYTSSSVYVTANDLASYPMGPWFSALDKGGVFQNFPSTQSLRAQIPLTPSVAATKTRAGLGPVGLLVNGVAIFNAQDGASYSNSTKADIGGGMVANGVLNVSAASFEAGPIAPGAMVSAFATFNAKLATSTAGAASPSWPTTLGGTTVTIRDSAGTTQAANIGYASPTQVNYRVPENVSSGIATVTITAGGTSISSSLNITSVYPNLFYFFNQENTAAAYITRVRNGQNTDEAIIQVSQSGAITAQPIDFGLETDQLYLILFGTGLGQPISPVVTVNVGNITASAVYAGAQGTWAGLDQYNVPLSRALIGKGKVNITVTVNGKVSNAVTLVCK